MYMGSCQMFVSKRAQITMRGYKWLFSSCTVCMHDTHT